MKGMLPGAGSRDRPAARSAGRVLLAAASAVTIVTATITATAGSALASTAPGAPGASATWNEANLQAFAGSLGSASNVWCTLGDGELENAFYRRPIILAHSASSIS